MSAPQLRVFTPESPPPKKRRLTLDEAWHRWILPGLRTEATEAEDRSSLARFAAAFQEVNPRTRSPGILLRQLDRAALAHVVKRLQADGASPDTIRKIIGTVAKTLRAAHQEGRLRRMPAVPRIRRRLPLPVPVTLTQVDQLYRAAAVADWPQLGKVEPAVTWRSWLIFFWVYGARTTDFVSYRSAAHTGLCWAAVLDQQECPAMGLEVISPAGWLRYTARKTGVPLVLPMHPVAAAHLEPFRGLDAERVWPNGCNKAAFQQTWRAIVAAAGLPPSLSIAGSGRPSLRKGASNNWDAVEYGLGAAVLGHVPQDTNGRHYRQHIPKLVAGIGRLHMPPAAIAR